MYFLHAINSDRQTRLLNVLGQIAMILGDKKNYGILIKSISTLMYTVWHVDKYKITFKLVINHWTNEIL